MYAARLSHVPSCDTLPARLRRRQRNAWVAVLAIALLVPAAAEAQNPTAAQRLRARGLSIIEGLLTDTINDAIVVTVQTVNAENLRAQEQALEAGETPELRYVIRSSGQTQARGMLLEDYGVIFTVQVPNLTYSHAALIQLGRGNTLRVIPPGGPAAIVAQTVAREAQLRNQMSRMGVEINSLTGSLETEIAASGATSGNAQRLRELIGEIQTVYDDYAIEAEEVAVTRQRADPREDARRGPESPRLSPFSIMSSADPEAVARANALANQQKNQVEGAVIAAVVDSLSYGHIINGLDDDDRLAVVLLPSSYLNRVVGWMPATQRAQEFVISVRYRDVHDLADDKITAEEFGGRIRVANRLGPAAQR